MVIKYKIITAKYAAQGLDSKLINQLKYEHTDYMVNTSGFLCASACRRTPRLNNIKASCSPASDQVTIKLLE